MRTLGIHSNYFRFAAHEKAMPAAEALKDKEHGIDKDCIVVYIAVEKEDEKDPEKVARLLVADTLERAKTLNADTVVVYPYVHLTHEPSSPKAALKVLQIVEAGIEGVPHALRLVQEFRDQRQGTSPLRMERPLLPVR